VSRKKINAGTIVRDLFPLVKGKAQIGKYFAVENKQKLNRAKPKTLR
jgi:hypothetical protein